MFRLPNGKIIDEKSVVKAMENNNLSSLFFLDETTGLVRSFPKKPTDKKYLKIPNISNSIILEWMKEYTDDFINFEDPKFAKKVYEILNDKEPFEKFKKILKQSEEGWIHGWDQWKSDCVYERLQDWFFNLPINIKEEVELSDNCAICKAMEEADKLGKNLSKKELEEAFAKANGDEMKVNKSNKTKLRFSI